MHEETGGPKNCHTTDAAWDNHRTKKNECGEELEMQDETIKKILTMLDQQNLRETFDENDTASEINKSPVFSQAFKDNMRAMVASRFGAEAAEQFIEDTADMYETSEVENPETAERMSQAKPAAPTAEVPLGAASPAETEGVSEVRKLFSKPKKKILFKWVACAAAVFIVAFAGFTVHKVGYVQATGLPSISAQPETTEEYSKVGSLKDIISNLEITDYPRSLKQVFVPDKVVDGFEETERSSKEIYLNIFYENAKDGWYQYQQTTVGAKSFIDTEDGDWDDVEIGTWPGLYSYKNDTGNLWWFDYNYAYHLQGNISKEEMVEVAESLVMEK